MRDANNSKYIYTNILTVMGFGSAGDVGIYKCSSLIGSEYIESTEYKNSETFLHVRNKSSLNNVIQSVGGEIEFKVTYKGYPIPTVNWLDNHNNTISWTKTENENAKFVATKSHYTASLKIRNLNFNDSGTFVFHTDNMYQNKPLSFELSGRVKPSRSS